LLTNLPPEAYGKNTLPCKFTAGGNTGKILYPTNLPPEAMRENLTLVI